MKFENSIQAPENNVKLVFKTIYILDIGLGLNPRPTGKGKCIFIRFFL